MNSLEKIIEEVRQFAEECYAVGYYRSSSKLTEIADRLSALQLELVATTLTSDAYDERTGVWLSAADWRALEKLPAGTELYVCRPGSAVDANPPKLTAEEACRLGDSIEGDMRLEANMKKKPTGFVATCQCGEVVGAVDYERTDRKDAGKILGQWIADGCTIEPRFGGTWSANVTACKCGA